MTDRDVVASDLTWDGMAARGRSADRHFDSLVGVHMGRSLREPAAAVRWLPASGTFFACDGMGELLGW